MVWKGSDAAHSASVQTGASARAAGSSRGSRVWQQSTLVADDPCGDCARLAAPGFSGSLSPWCCANTPFRLAECRSAGLRISHGTGAGCESESGIRALQEGGVQEDGGLNPHVRTDPRPGAPNLNHLELAEGATERGRKRILNARGTKDDVPAQDRIGCSGVLPEDLVGPDTGRRRGGDGQAKDGDKDDGDPQQSYHPTPMACRRASVYLSRPS
jgi:hypothetical protein